MNRNRLRLLFIILSGLWVTSSFAELPVYSGLGAEFEMESTAAFNPYTFPKKNHVSLVSFGFTQCHDICPLLMQRYSNILKAIDDKSAQVPQVVFVTVDPERDTIKTLSTYIENFDQRIVGVRPTPKALDQIQKDFAMRIMGGNESHTIAHTDRLYLFDKKQQLRGLYALSQSLDDIIQAIDELQGE